MAKVPNDSLKIVPLSPTKTFRAEFVDLIFFLPEIQGFVKRFLGCHFRKSVPRLRSATLPRLRSATLPRLRSVAGGTSTSLSDRRSSVAEVELPSKVEVGLPSVAEVLPFNHQSNTRQCLPSTIVQNFGFVALLRRWGVRVQDHPTANRPTLCIQGAIQKKFRRSD